MDYSALAAELLSFRTALHHLPAVRGLDEMSGGEYFVLHFLLRHGGTAGPSELSRSLYASSARIAALLKHLEAKGWIVRTPDAADVRRVDVVLTEAGAACIRERLSAVLDEVSGLLSALSRRRRRNMSDCSASCSRREEPFEKTHRLAGGPLCRARKGRRIGTLCAADRSDRRSAVPGRRADEAGPAPELSHRRRDAGRRAWPVLARRGAVHDAHRHQDRHGADAHEESAAHPRRELCTRLCHHRGRTGPAGAGGNGARTSAARYFC